MWNKFDELITASSPEILIKLKMLANHYATLATETSEMLTIRGVESLADEISIIRTDILELNLKANYIDNTIYNIVYFLKQTRLAIEVKDFDQVTVIFNFTLKGLIKRVCFETYSFVMICESEQGYRAFFDQQFEFLDGVSNGTMKLPEEDYKYKASLIVYVYKNAQFTQECIESIYAHTKGIGTDYELIIRSDGYDEETNKYLDSLKVEKKFLYPKNVRLFDDVIDAAEGKYIFGINNDIVLTDHWLDNLLKCLENSEKIGMVVPAANVGGNGQALSGVIDANDSMETVQEKIKQFNQSNASKWIEQDTLINYLWGMPSKLVKAIMLDDLLFTGGFYTDIDLSMRIKRAGYRLIYTTDTFVYHHGSASYSHVSDEVFAEMENLFMQKYGFTSSGENFNGHILDTNRGSVNAILSEVENKSVNILSVDDGIGSESLNVKRVLQQHGASSKIYSCLHNLNYAPYVRSSSEETFVFPADNDFTKITVKFDLIVLPNISQLPDNLANVINQLRSLLSDHGKIIMLVSNSRSFALNVGFLMGRNLTRYRANISAVKATTVDVVELSKQLNDAKISSDYFTAKEDQLNLGQRLLKKIGINQAGERNSLKSARRAIFVINKSNQN